MEMRTYTEDWVAAGRYASESAKSSVCEKCGTPKAVGYSNLGVPMACCPNCSPSLVANGKRSVGDAWGFRDV